MTPSPLCPSCGSPLRLRRSREGETFWACAQRKACGWTWPGDEHRPTGTSVEDGPKMPFVLAEVKKQALIELYGLGLGSKVRLTYVGQILNCEDLLELGTVRGELRTIREGRKR